MAIFFQLQAKFTFLLFITICWIVNILTDVPFTISFLRGKNLLFITRHYSRRCPATYFYFECYVEVARLWEIFVFLWVFFVYLKYFLVLEGFLFFIYVLAFFVWILENVYESYFWRKDVEANRVIFIL